MLVAQGCVISHFRFCNFGSAFEKHSKWLHNQPWLIPLESSCSCPHKGNHFVIKGKFTHAIVAAHRRLQFMADFHALANPSPATQVLILTKWSAGWPAVCGQPLVVM